MVICSKWLRAQVGWSFIEHSALPRALWAPPTYALSYTYIERCHIKPCLQYMYMCTFQSHFGTCLTYLLLSEEVCPSLITLCEKDCQSFITSTVYMWPYYISYRKGRPITFFVGISILQALIRLPKEVILNKKFIPYMWCQRISNSAVLGNGHIQCTYGTPEHEIGPSMLPLPSVSGILSVLPHCSCHTGNGKATEGEGPWDGEDGAATETVQESGTRPDQDRWPFQGTKPSGGGLEATATEGWGKFHSCHTVVKFPFNTCRCRFNRIIASHFMHIWHYKYIRDVFLKST